MPTYSVEEILNIIQTLTHDQKSQLQAQLPSVLILTTVPTTPQNSQTQSVGNVNNIGSNNNVALNLAHGGHITSSQNNTQVSVKNANLQEALTILKKLKEDVNQSNTLNKLEKTTIEGTINVAEGEITKQEPDKSLFNQAIEALKKGLAVISLVEPVMKVAALVAQAWAG